MILLCLFANRLEITTSDCHDYSPEERDSSAELQLVGFSRSPTIIQPASLTVVLVEIAQIVRTGQKQWPLRYLAVLFYPGLTNDNMLAPTFITS